MEINWIALKQRYKEDTTENLIALYKSGDLTDRVQQVLMAELQSRGMAVPSAAECGQYRAKREQLQQAGNRQVSRMWQLAIFIFIASGLGLTGILSHGVRRAWLIEAYHEVFKTEKYYLDQGVNLLSRSQYQQALDNFLKAEEKAPNNYKTHVALGSTYAALRQQEQAITHFRRAIVLQPDPGFDPEAYQSLSLCYLFLGENGKATEYLNKAVFLYDSAGKQDQAIQARRQLQRLQSGK